MSSTRGWFLVAGLLLAGVLLATARMSDARNEALDDAFITYRYAQNLVHGAGLRYNLDDPAPVEGFSSLLHVLWTAATYRVGLAPLVATRLLGPLALLAVGLAFAWVWVRRGVERQDGLMGAAVLVFAVALLPETSIHLAGGMETLLFAMTAGLAHAWYFDALHHERLSPGQVAVGLGLVFALLIARPEGVIVAGTMVGFLGVKSSLQRRSLRLPLGYWVLGLGSALLLVGLLLWKWSYFGDWAPLPYYVKSHNSLYGSAGIAFPGLREVLLFSAARFLPAVGLALFLLGFRRAIADPSARLRLFGFLLPSLVALLSYTRVIHEVTPGFRYQYPYVWPVLALAAFGLCQRMAAAPLPARCGAVGAVLALSLLFGSEEDITRPPWNWIRRPVAALAGFAHEPEGGSLAAVGLDLKATGVEGARVATTAAGLIPFRSGWSTLDLVGLNDPVLSGKFAMTPARAFEYIDDKRPDVLATLFPPATPGSTSPANEPLLAREVGRRAVEGAFTELYRYWDQTRLTEMIYREMAYLRDHYQFGAAYPVAGPWFIISYVRKDSPHRERILSTLRSSSRADTETDLAPFYGNDPRQLGAVAP